MASSDSSGGGGFEFNFIGNVKDFECPLCLHVTREPNLTSCCGQHFCGSCINRIINVRKPCPFCKESQFAVFLDKKQNRKVLQLEVECSQISKNCDWTGKLCELDAHVNDECRYVNVTCPRGCGIDIQRWMLDKHMRNSCPNRLYVCKFCGRMDTYQLITTKHFPMCPKYPVHCPNNCTVDMFKREVLNDHITQDCPLQQVDCEYKCFGCSAVVVRRAIAEHMEENTQQHILLVTKQLKSTQEKLLQMEQKLRGAEDAITFLTKKVEDSLFMVPLTFSIHNFSRLQMQAVPVGKYTLLTHPNGYRLHFACGVANNILGFVLHKVDTENENLQWPLRCTIHVMILNQLNEQNHIMRSCDVCIDNNHSTMMKLTRLCVSLVDVVTVRPSVRYVCHDRLLVKVDVVNIKNDIYPNM